MLFTQCCCLHTTDTNSLFFEPPTWHLCNFLINAYRLAATHLEKLLHNFSQEPQLWQEVSHITNSLQEEATDIQSLFYQNAFQVLKTNKLL